MRRRAGDATAFGDAGEISEAAQFHGGRSYTKSSLSCRSVMGRIKHRYLRDARGRPRVLAGEHERRGSRLKGAAMEFGWYHEFHRQVEGQSDADAFEQGFEQVEAADRWGLDVFWLAEIHQQARRSVLSAPMNVAGQIAAPTKRIKSRTTVHVLPLTHPLRLAEQTATVDQVSRGRFILGAGRSA